MSNINYQMHSRLSIHNHSVLCNVMIKDLSLYSLANKGVTGSTLRSKCNAISTVHVALFIEVALGQLDNRDIT